MSESSGHNIPGLAKVKGRRIGEWCLRLVGWVKELRRNWWCGGTEQDEEGKAREQLATSTSVCSSLGSTLKGACEDARWSYRGFRFFPNCLHLGGGGVILGAVERESGKEPREETGAKVANK